MNFNVNIIIYGKGISGLYLCVRVVRKISMGIIVEIVERIFRYRYL